MPARRVHVRDHDRRKPHQEDEIHVDDYQRVQEVGAGPPAGAAELGPVGHHGDIDEETALIESIEVELHGETRTCELCGEELHQDEMVKLPSGEWYCKSCEKKVPPVEEKKITAIDFSHVGRVDLGVPAGKYHKWERVTQREALQKIKENGADVLVGNEDGSVHRYNLMAALRAKSFFEDVERKTGKKVVFNPHLEVGRRKDGLAFPTLQEARSEVRFVRPSFERLGVKPIIVMQQNGYIEYPKRPAYVYWIASDNTATWQCWDGVYKEV